MNTEEGDEHARPVIQYPHNQKIVRLPIMATVMDGDTHAIVLLDAYEVTLAWEVHNPAAAHALKKILRAGQDQNTKVEDYTEAMHSLKRAVEIQHNQEDLKMHTLFK